MSRLPILVKERAQKLRRKGYSIREITKKLNIGQGTASVWLRNIRLSPSAQKRLLSRIKKGQFVSAQNKKARTVALNESLFLDALKDFRNLKLSRDIRRLICAMLYWCEGAKDYSYISFTNSDPKLVRRFIDLLVNDFGVTRRKIWARLHLHKYHNSRKQLKFWSRALDLDLGQFRQPFIKPNTGKRIRENYPGCVNISYYDSILARKILYLSRAYLGYGGVS
ncbi:MAG: hypothetical protein HYW77_01370 [Parcubacteria group bacterium]|nr:hypothetical protein [Parcubacteria group bacterium]